MLRYFLCLLTMLACAATAAASERVFVGLRPTASVERAEVRLGDIADVIARDPSLAARIARQPVGRLPTLTKPVAMRQHEIIRALANQAPELASAIDWGGNMVVEISGRPQTVNLSPAIDQAVIWIMGRIAGAGRVELDLVDGGGMLSVPPGTVDIRPNFQSVRRFGGRIAVPLRVSVDGVVIAEPVVEFVVRQIAPARLAITSPKPGEQSPAIHPGDAAKVAKADTPATSKALPISGELNASTPNGEIVVTRNQAVRILVDAGVVRVESDGIALDNARAGESVHVRRSTGGTPILGRAIDRNLVMLDEK